MMKTATLSQLPPSDEEGHSPQRETGMEKHQRPAPTLQTNRQSLIMGISKKLFTRKAEREAERGSTSKEEPSVQENTRGSDSQMNSLPANKRNENPSVESSGFKEPSGSDKQRRHIAQLEAQIQDMSSENEQRAERISNLIYQLHEEHSVAQQQAGEIKRQDQIIHGLQRDISRLQEQKKQLEAMEIGRQEDALQSLVVNKWHVPKEDRYARDELSKLGDKIRQWAKSNSVATCSDLDGLATSDRDLAVQYLSGYCAYHDWDTVISKFPVSRDRIPALLLQASLAKDLFGKLFTDPFFALIATDGDKSVPGPKEMRTLQDAIAQVSESAAHIWRSQTIHNLSTTTNPKTLPLLAARIEPICNRFVTDFLRGPVRILLQDNGDPLQMQSKQFQELQALFKGAAQLALTLWGQRASMVCRTLQGLPPFTIANDELSAHRLHHLDEDDTRLDGKGVLLLLQPAVLAYGSENAEHYDQHKLWSPAVVLLDTK